MKRLFDILERNAKENPHGTAFAKKENHTWIEYPNKNVALQVENLAASLLRILGLPEAYTPEKMHKIGIISDNRPEWLITDMAVQQASAILTPIYPTVGIPDLEFILNESDIRIIFVSNQEIYNRFKSVLNQAQYKIYSFDKLEGIANWETLLVQHSSESLLRESKANITENTLATIIYTSGTTGNPKGVMLSHKNIMSNVKDSMPQFHFANAGVKTLSFLPLNHIFEKTMSYIYLYKGAQIYYAESMETIGENLREVQPSVFTCVPRVLEKVFDKIVAKGRALKGIKKALFFWALNLAKKYDNHKDMGVWYNLQLRLANKLIFSKWREALGGRVKAIISGSAALNPDLIRIFTAAEIIIMEGYGLTETSPVVSVNTYNNEGRVFGTVGPPIQNVQVKLEEDGEILVKGNNVMLGYYKNEEETKKVITEDGWLRTGDIGIFTEKKLLKITDRKKEIFKTSGGKYVAPQYVENIYRTVDTIAHIMVLGDGKKFVSALIAPEWSVVAQKLNKGETIPLGERKVWAQKPELIELIGKGLKWAAPKINPVEQVKTFRIVPEDWTIENGILTPKLSLRRKAVMEKYQAEIDELYAGTELQMNEK